MYLNLLDNKGGLPVIFAASVQRMIGEEKKLRRVDIHHHDHQLLYLLNTAQVRYVSQTWSSVPELNLNA